MRIFIKLTTVGADAGPFDLYSNLDLITPFATGVDKSTLLIGDTYISIDGTTSVSAISSGLCTNLTVLPTTTSTSTSTSTSTTTTTSSTTTTTTTAVPTTTTTSSSTTTTTTTVEPTTTTTSSTTTTTTTLEPTTTTTSSTTTTTTTVLCERPLGLTTGYAVFRYTDSNSSTWDWQLTSVVDACDAHNYFYYTIGGSLVSILIQFSTLEVGQLMYKYIGTDCTLLDNGYYWFTVDSNISTYFRNNATISVVTIVNGYVTAIDSCTVTPTTTTTTTTTSTSTSTSTTTTTSSTTTTTTTAVPTTTTTTTTTSSTTTTTTTAVPTTTTTTSSTTTTTTTCIDPQILTLTTQTDITSSGFTLYADPITIGCASTLLTNGIEMSVNSDMSDYVSINAPTVDLNTFNINFSNPLVGHSWQIQPSTTYYYRAVMDTTVYNGVSLWYGLKRTVVTLAATTTTTTSSTTTTTTTAVPTTTTTSSSTTTTTSSTTTTTTTAVPTTTTTTTSSTTTTTTTPVPTTTTTSSTTTTTSSTTTTTSSTTTTTTTAIPIPALEVYLTNFVYITCNGFQSNGVVTGDGGSPIISNGVCYSTSPSPTISGSHTHDGGDIGTFISTVGSLTATRTYYVRAYATNSITTVYSSEYVINTLTPATININNLSTNMVVSNVTVEGINLTGDSYPLTTGNSTSGTVCNLGSLPIEVYISSGSSNQHVRVIDSYGVPQYASYSGGADIVIVTNVNVASSSPVTVDLLPGTYTAPSLPTLTTFPVNVTSQSTMTGGGSVDSDGGATVTNYGICWSTSQFPTILNSYTTSTIGYPNFITYPNGGLSADVIYYVRAFATNSVGTAYGNQVQFIIQYVPGATHPIFFANPVTRGTYLHIINMGITNTIQIVNGGGSLVQSYSVAPFQNADIFISAVYYSAGTYGIRFKQGITLLYDAILIII